MPKLLIALVLVVPGVAYACGWRRLSAAGHPPPWWRPVLYLSGLLTVAAALVSPLDELADKRFSVHMIQHMLLTMVAAPLLLLGNPLAVLLWGVPGRLRRTLARPLARGSRVRRVLATLTLLPVAWLLYVGDLWIWHLPSAYQAALEHESVHILEHLAFFATAVLFWWPIIRPAPRLHATTHPGFQIVYLVAATAQSVALGGILSVPERLLYPYYGRIDPGLGINALDDQMLAGGIMWESSHMYLLPILLILYGLSRRDQRASAVDNALEPEDETPAGSDATI